MTTSSAGGAPVEVPVRPAAWKCSRCGNTCDCEGAAVGDNWCNSCGACDAMGPLYGRAALDAAVAAERERCAKVADEHARRTFTWASENSDLYHAQADWAEAIAKSIRQLKA